MNKFDIKDTILFQYSSSSIIKAVIEGVNDLIKPDEDINLVYNEMFNILSAQGVGLDFWGVKIGIGRKIKIQSTVDENDSFGFYGSELNAWDTVPFFSEKEGDVVKLEDNAYRELLLIKAAANISRTDIASLENLLERLYSGRGKFYFLEIGVMKLRYIFEFYLTPYEESLAMRRDLPPKPAGVTYEIYQIVPEKTFGFEGSGMNGFDNGVFDPKGIQATYTNANKTF